MFDQMLWVSLAIDLIKFKLVPLHDMALVLGLREQLQLNSIKTELDHKAYRT